MDLCICSGVESHRFGGIKVDISIRSGNLCWAKLGISRTGAFDEWSPIKSSRVIISNKGGDCGDLEHDI